MNPYCFAVMYGNYNPPEIDSLWYSAADAERRGVVLSKLIPDAPWHVEKMDIFTHESGQELLREAKP